MMKREYFLRCVTCYKPIPISNTENLISVGRYEFICRDCFNDLMQMQDDITNYVVRECAKNRKHKEEEK